jgi:general L-amino acid transport system permease protein
VIVPQALRVIIPPLTSQYLNITKNSSLAIAIGYMDVVATIGGISLMQTGKEMETMAIVIGVYLVLSLTISAFMNWFNRKMKLKER